jgi:phosphate starvation-inducible PhoH-like protein
VQQTVKPSIGLNSHVSRDFECSNNLSAQQLCGELNKNLHLIEQATGAEISARGEVLHVSGRAHAVDLTISTLEQLTRLLDKGYPLFSQDISFAVNILAASPHASLEEIFFDKICITARKRVISPKSVNQKRYIEAIRSNDIVFGIGPAGTGKTYLAVAMAVASLAREQVHKIILTRPAVEAGEKLGFLPGDMAQKIDPYLRPLTDAINEMMGQERTMELVERGVIEVAPLAFMRGRTLNNAFIILDEAQNTTREQMKMFLTRIGFDSRAVITGDITQIDLPGTHKSGLVQAQRILAHIKGIRFCAFDKSDVVRHRLVQEIIQAYEQQKGAESIHHRKSRQGEGTAVASGTREIL